jgi:hypothetical protein
VSRRGGPERRQPAPEGLVDRACKRERERMNRADRAPRPRLCQELRRRAGGEPGHADGPRQPLPRPRGRGDLNRPGAVLALRDDGERDNGGRLRQPLSSLTAEPHDADGRVEVEAHGRSELRLEPALGRGRARSDDGEGAPFGTADEPSCPARAPHGDRDGQRLARVEDACGDDCARVEPHRNRPPARFTDVDGGHVAGKALKPEPGEARRAGVEPDLRPLDQRRQPCSHEHEGDRQKGDHPSPRRSASRASHTILRSPVQLPAGTRRIRSRVANRVPAGRWISSR